MGAEVTDPLKILTLSGSDPALKQYESLIYSTWLRGLRFGNPWFEDISSDAYYEAYHRVVENILSRPGCVVKLAVLSDDEDTCIGWSAAEGNTLHFVFVKGDIQARNRGIATRLLPQNIDVITHLTKTGRVIWKKKFPNAVFNPFT